MLMVWTGMPFILSGAENSAEGGGQQKVQIKKAVKGQTEISGGIAVQLTEKAVLKLDDAAPQTCQKRKPVGGRHSKTKLHLVAAASQTGSLKTKLMKCAQKALLHFQIREKQ